MPSGETPEQFDHWSESDTEPDEFEESLAGRRGTDIDIEVTQSTDGVVIVRVRGEIDRLTSPVLRGKLTEHVSPAVSMVVDLNDVSFLDSTGLSVLIFTKQEIGNTGGGCVLLASTDAHAVQRPLQVTGLDQELALCTDLAEALDLLADRHE